ncbi:rubrerythrin family protein [Halopenitus persicus]|uniref:rubrerythrin family protein n=1 Tax=Halopenitus persicus TaxID=1048396 RepID=UPI000BBB5B36|nr:rubrerythrin family protein [Halopenitus persicus]
MTPDDVLETVQSDLATELSRLGSSKALYAATEGELEADRVLRAAEVAERAAAETFAAWADDEPDADAREAFESVAADERAHAERVREELDEDVDASADGTDTDDLAIPTHLRSVEETVERAGALLGRILVADESKSQYVGYFVGDADPQTAGVFRDLRGDLDDQRERALELLETVCEDESDWEVATEAAAAVVRVAYEEHVETLESLGVDPKPVC